MSRPLAFDIEELTRHADWVRALARKLVNDEHLADDLAQETWLAALSHPPDEGRPVRPWLAAILRNFRRQSRRQDRRRSAREQSLERSEDSPSTGEVVEQVEAHRMIVDAVLALSEPYRTTLLLRYFRGWSGAEIARQTGVPEGTVRSQVKRGLNDLRRRFDAERGGDRGAWCLTLLPLLKDPVAAAAGAKSLALGTTVMVALSKKLLVATAVLLAVPTIWILSHDSGGTPVEIGEFVDTTGTNMPADDTSGAAVMDNPVGQAVHEEVNGATDGAGNVSGESGGASLAGRLVDPAGQPIAAIAMSLVGRANSSSSKGTEAPAPPVRLEANTDADGRFALSFDAPPTHYFLLRVTPRAPYVPATWMFQQIGARERRDLGDQVIEVGGSVMVRVVDEGGSPIPDGWSVSIKERFPEATGERQAPSVWGRPTGQSGTCRIDGVPPRLCSTTLNLNLGDRCAGPDVEVRPTELVDIEIRYAGADPSVRIRLSTSVSPLVTIGPDPSRIELIGPDGSTRKPQSNSHNTFVFDDIPPGRHSINIDDPRFVPWRKNDVTPGRSISAHLRGSSSIRLLVSDARTGDAVSDYRLSLLPKHFTVFPKQIVLKDIDDDPPADGLYADLVADRYDLLVESPDFAPYEMCLRDFRAGERRAVNVDLIPGGTITGVVLRADRKTPVPGAAVHLGLAAALDDGPDSRWIESGDWAPDPERCRVGKANQVADETGRFRFDVVPAGTWVLRAQAGAEAYLPGISVTLDELHEDLRLILPPTGFLHGRVSGGAGKPISGMRLAVVPGDEEADLPSSVVWSDSTAKQFERFSCMVESDGSYRVGPVPSGPAHVVLLPAALRRSKGKGEHSSHDPSATLPGQDLGTVVILEDRDTRKDFDLGRDVPGQAVVQVIVNGQPGRSHTVVARSRDGSSSHDVQVDTDEGGRATLDLLAGLWALFVRCDADHWTHSYPAHVRIDASPGAPITIHVQTVEADLIVLDEQTGDPLGGQELFLMSDVEADVHATVLRTDANGRLRLRRPTGEIEFALWGPDGFPNQGDSVTTQSVRWTANGPDPDTIRFRR